jgi:hypothetical protein
MVSSTDLGVCLAMACLVGCLGTPSTCDFDLELVLEPVQTGEHSVAVRVLAEAGDADEYVATFQGSATNQSTQTPCAFAIYEFEQFDTPPNREDIAPVVVGETPPHTIAGGGRLQDSGVLPARSEQIFEVPFDTAGLGEFFVPEIDSTIVIALCSEPDVDLDVTIQLLACAQGNDAPPRQPDWLEQLW